MLTIRFSRVGKTNKASFRVVLAENSAPIKGRFLELLGNYDPHSKKAVLKNERVLYWLEKGATLSDSVHNLLVREGILKTAKRAVKMEKKTPENSEKPAEAAAVAPVDKQEEKPEEKKKETVETAK